MSKVDPYHTNSPEEPPSHRNVHHDHDDCHDGRAIKRDHKDPGTGGKPLCKVCSKLG